MRRLLGILLMCLLVWSALWYGYGIRCREPQPDFHNISGFGISPVLARSFAESYVTVWWTLFLSAIGSGWLAVRGTRRKRRTGACEKCGYDLRATPGRCPECG